MGTQTRSRTAGQIALLVGGVVIALLALAIAAGGGTAIWADTTQKDSQGYISTAKHEYTSASRAIVTKSVHLGTSVPEWLIGKVRIEALSGDSARPIFVGIARKKDVDAYLAGVDHAVVEHLDWDPFRVTYEQRAGTRVPADPASQTFWAASARGAGTIDLKWETSSGSWSVVVMNTDGLPGVEARASVGISVPNALWIGIGLLVFGGLVLVGAALMIVRGWRRRPPGQQAAAAAAAASS
jgi:hypothetical protein